jgi:RNA polymerase sigma-70 factor (ECF subfamily)
VDEVTRLAVAATRGDRLALHGFVRATQAEVWRFCAHLASRDQADDLVQETYLRAMRSLPSFRAEASARTWLLSIARRAVYDGYRSTRRRRLLAETLRAETLRAEERGPGRGACGSGPDPGGIVSIQLAVAALEVDRRAAFVLTQLLGLPYDEAAEVCGCPVGTIRSRVARARQDLIDALAERRSAPD